MSKSIVVTGAGGYIGRHVVQQLLDRGFSVTAVDFHLEDVDARAIKLNLDVFAAGDTVFDDLGRPDVVVHLAWRDGFRHDSSAHIEDLPKHYRFVESLLKSGLAQLAVMGSMHEVGYWEGPIDETTPCRPASLYGIAKNCLRQICEVLAVKYGTTLQWIRAFYIVGDDARSNSVFSKLLMASSQGRTSFPFTSGQNKYDFISVDELARQIALIVAQDAVTGVINACSGVPVALSDMVERYIKAQGLNIKLEYGSYPDRPYDSPAIWGDNSKIRMIISTDQVGQLKN